MLDSGDNEISFLGCTIAREIGKEHFLTDYHPSIITKCHVIISVDYVTILPPRNSGIFSTSYEHFSGIEKLIRNTLIVFGEHNWIIIKNRIVRQNRILWIHLI